MAVYGYGDWAPFDWHVECDDCWYLGPCGNRLNAIREHNTRVLLANKGRIKMTESPTEPGGFVGDIFFGDPEHTTLGTHRWDGAKWCPLADATESLVALLAKERAANATLLPTNQRDPV